MKTSNSTRVPDEILLNILKEAKLNPLELVKLATVDKQFNRVSASNDLWHDETPEAVRRAVVDKRSTWGAPRDERSEFKTAFLSRMKNREYVAKNAYRSLLLQPGHSTSAEKLLDVRSSRYHDTNRSPEDIQEMLAARQDYDIVKQFVSRYPHSFAGTFIESHLRADVSSFLHDPAIALSILKKSPGLLHLFNAKIQDSKTHVIASLTNREPTLEFASERLQNNLEVAHQAVRMNTGNYAFVGELLLSRKDLFFAAFSVPDRNGENYHPKSLARIPEAVLEDPEAAIMAINARLPIWMLPQETQSLPEVILAGLKRHRLKGFNPDISDAMTELRRNDSTFMLHLARREPSAVHYIGELLRYDMPFMRELASIAPQSGILTGGGPAAKDSWTVSTLLSADKHSGSLISKADLSLRKNPAMQKLAFEHGASIEDLQLDRAGALKAWFIFKKSKKT